MDRFQFDGFAILRQVFPPSDIGALIDALSCIDQRAGVRTRGGVYAIRSLLDVSAEVRQLAMSECLASIVKHRLAGNGRPVRGTLLDKTPRANWLVPWHQDLTICVEDRIDTPGFGPWTRKAGIWHVQPPPQVLRNMLSVRIHLDDSDCHNGALRVLPGTHSTGRLTAAQIATAAQEVKDVTCDVRAGDVLLMRPLLVHASSASARAAHRRVIHLDYAAEALPVGLRWRT